jgi:cytidylate kinase
VAARAWRAGRRRDGRARYRDGKIFLDASPEERARRRATDPAHASGRGTAGIPDVATALAERDRIDRTRPASPLVQAADAVVIDTTGLEVDDVVRQVLELVGKKRE